MIQFTHSLVYSLLISPLIVLLLFLSMENYTVGAQQQNQPIQPTRLGTPIAIAITGNVLTVVSFLIGTSSFILGLRIQNAAKSATTPSLSITKYFEILILALVIPAIIINIFGILLVGSHLYPADSPYLALVYALFIPAGAILFLVVKLHSLK
jgi:heme/copper-type cytochrome/quinol oxidase subunit 2